MKQSKWWLFETGQPEITHIRDGLSESEAAKRLIEFGANTFKVNRSNSSFWQFVNKFKNPLVLVLLCASFISALTGEVVNCLIISTMVLLSVTLDFFQEYKANAAADKLRQSVSVRTTVLRNGVAVDISIQEVVHGDVALMSAGDLIPADGLVLEAKDFFVNQSTLTGEAFPVKKNPGILPSTATQLSDARNAVFMGTSVVGGSARILVIKTGIDTEIGDIAKTIQKPSHATSFDVGTHRFGMLIMWLTVVLVLFVLLINAWFNKPWLESFLFAVALAVGLTPELLPVSYTHLTLPTKRIV